MSGRTHQNSSKTQYCRKADITEPEGGYCSHWGCNRLSKRISVPVDQVTSNSGFIEPGDRVIFSYSVHKMVSYYGNSSQGLYVGNDSA
ncbi:hypothetical protein O9992_21995 [Vibrio lentus]|nr:hypothetical protein [Vibrio lentus]